MAEKQAEYWRGSAKRVEEFNCFDFEPKRKKSLRSELEQICNDIPGEPEYLWKCPHCKVFFCSECELVSAFARQCPLCEEQQIYTPVERAKKTKAYWRYLAEEFEASVSCLRTFIDVKNKRLVERERVIEELRERLKGCAECRLLLFEQRARLN